MADFDWKGRSYSMLCCGECGTEFAVPAKFDDEKRANGAAFYCPNGHSRVYRESQVDKLRRERDRLQQDMARVEDEKREAERRAILAEKREQRLKKRAAAGSCPCCKRSFSNMARHMKDKHPEFLGDNVVKMKESAA